MTIKEDENRKIVCRYTPLGVSVGIIPWNYPFALACAKLGPAVLAGNPMIMKPSPFTPYTCLKLSELAQDFFPPGVVQALSGDDRLGPWLTSHPVPEKISFTGSTVTGKKVMEAAAGTMKRVTLELGGNDPAIICADVDIEQTAKKVRHYPRTCEVTHDKADHEIGGESLLPELWPNMPGHKANLCP